MITRIVAAGVALGLLLGPTASASAFPERTVRIIVPFAPGGVTDVAARLVGQQLSAKWGQPVVIENRPGGGGTIGTEAGVRAEPDGHTILMATNGDLVITPAISAKLRYNPQTDLLPIAMVTTTPYAWVVSAGAGFNSLRELVAAAKAKPGEIAYASAGHGSTVHLATEQFAHAAGIKLLHVPYKGGAPAATAIATGEVPGAMVALSAVKPIVDSGRAKAVAVTSAARLKAFPDVPTVNETGVIAFEASIWTGLFAPKGTPAAIVEKIRVDTLAALKEPSLVEKFQSVGAEPAAVSGDDLAKLIARETKDVSAAAQAAGIRLD